MKRIISVLAVAALMAVMMVAMAVPAFAAGGGASVKNPKHCSTGVIGLDTEVRCQIVTTPSGNQIIQIHHHQSDTSGPSRGGGAEVVEPQCRDNQSGQVTITPSGNINGHCQGSARTAANIFTPTVPEPG